MSFAMQPIEIRALRKLALVNKALATKLTGRAAAEQAVLTQVLVCVLDRYEIEAAKPKSIANDR